MGRRISIASLIGIIILGAFLVVGALYLSRQFEWHAPTVTIDLPADSVGLRPFEIDVRDLGKGLGYVAVSLVREDASWPIHFAQFDATTKQHRVNIQLDPEKLELTEGPAVLRVTATDGSYWNFFRGNLTVVDRPVNIDLTPPTIQVLAEDRYITVGGSGLVIFKTSPDTQVGSVTVGAYRFPAHRGFFADPDVFMTFFSHPYNVASSKRATVTAEDAAGNKRELKLPYSLRDARFRNVKVQVSNGFIENKVAPLLPEASLAGNGHRDIFIKVNRQMRRENEETIEALCRKSKAEKMWTGRFVQLSNSKVEANFADRRSYFYNGEMIDEARHLGYDLAVTKHYPVEAANHGIVIFAGPLGIYGNTVMLDHGFGICTLYAHLSSITVKPEERVTKGQKIGRTGETGLATGDHLHYSTYIYGVPVLPLEWWDGKWINENIQSKLTAFSKREEAVGAVPGGTTPAR